MRAQRQHADPAPTARPVEAAPLDHVTPVDHRTLRTGDIPTSPAILLQEQLAARLAQVEAIAAETPDMSDVPEVRKWPMAARVATIVALSFGLWGGVFLATVAILT